LDKEFLKVNDKISSKHFALSFITDDLLPLFAEILFLLQSGVSKIQMTPA